MSWVKRKNNYSYRHPKVYRFSADDGEKIQISRKTFLMILGLATLLFIIWFLFGSNYFKVKEITTSGSLNPEVQSEIDSFKGKNIFTFVLGNTEEELKQKQSSINKISILRGIPDMLRINVEVRQPIIAWKSQDKTYYIDKNGIIFEFNGESADYWQNQKLPTVFDQKNLNFAVGKQIVSPDFVQFTVDVNKLIGEKTSKKFQEARINETTYQLEVLLDNNIRVLFDTLRKAEVQVNVLAKIFDQYQNDIHEYVDLRVEGRVYYK